MAIVKDVKEDKSPVLKMFEELAVAVDVLHVKRKVADDAQAAADKANSELSQATAKLQDLRNRMHDTLGGTLNEVGRVRQTN